MKALLTLVNKLQQPAAAHADPLHSSELKLVRLLILALVSLQMFVFRVSFLAPGFDGGFELVALRIHMWVLWIMMFFSFPCSSRIMPSGLQLWRKRSRPRLRALKSRYCSRFCDRGGKTVNLMNCHGVVGTRFEVFLSKWFFLFFFFSF